MSWISISRTIPVCLSILTAVTTDGTIHGIIPIHIIEGVGTVHGIMDGMIRGFMAVGTVPGIIAAGIAHGTTAAGTADIIPDIGAADIMAAGMVAAVIMVEEITITATGVEAMLSQETTTIHAQVDILLHEEIT